MPLFADFPFAETDPTHRRRVQVPAFTGHARCWRPCLRAAPVSLLCCLIAAPAFAAETNVSATLSWFFGGFGGLAAIISFFVLFSQNRKMKRIRARHADDLKATSTIFEALEAGNAGTFAWTATGSTGSSKSLCHILGIGDDKQLSWEDILEVFDEAGRVELHGNVERLKIGGDAFSTIVRTENQQKYFQVKGTRGDGDSTGATLLWIQDITDRASALISLEREKRRLRGLLDAVPVPIWSRNDQLRIFDCNLAYVEAVEAEAREAVLADGKEFAEGDVAERARALAEKALEEGKRAEDSDHIIVNGERRRFELVETPLQRGAYTAGYALDRTEVEKLGNAIKELDGAQEEVLDRLALAIMIFDADRHLRFANSACARLWELDENWMEDRPEIGQVLDRLRERRLLPETGDFSGYKDEWRNYFTSLIEPKEELIHLPNGKAIWTVISPHPTGGMVVTYEDVTEELKLERSYNTLVDTQQATLDNLSEGIAVFGEDGKLKLSNPVFLSLWGLTDEELAATPHLAHLIDLCKDKFSYGDDWDRFKKTYLARIFARKQRSGRMNTRQGEVYAYSIVPVPDGGVLLSFRDITDSTRVENALRDRNDALEAADRLKSEFVANVSYELRSPLTAIIGFAEILNNQYFGEINEKQREYVDGVLDASGRLLALINNILDLAVIEAGRMMLEIHKVDVAEMLQSIADNTGDWVQERNLKLRVDCDPDVGEIDADPRRLKQAVYNLLVNAITFTPVGGRIAIAARRRGDEIALAVVDNGVGISTDDRDRVFQTFVRGVAPDSKQQGAGIGLSLVKKFIELHGGQVHIDSTPGRGTCVTCLLPAKQTETPNKKRADRKPDTVISPHLGADTGKIAESISP